MAAASTASCINTEHGCVMFDCLVHLWDWLDPPAQAQFQMENNRTSAPNQQPITQQHFMAQHVHPEQIYSQQHQSTALHSPPQHTQLEPNGVMHQLLQSQYHSNMDVHSPLLENRQEIYGTSFSQEINRHYRANDNYNYSQSPPKCNRTEIATDYNVNSEMLQNMPKGYNPEVYQDYMKRNPPKDMNQIYQNQQPTFRPNVNQTMNQYDSKPYLPFSNRIGPQSNTELLRRQYNEIQQMKLQQQIQFQNQAQMHQQQKFAERQILLQQIHGIQPPPNLQNSIYSDGSSRDLDRFGSRNDFKEYSSTDIQKEVDRYAKNNDFTEIEKQQRKYEESSWHINQGGSREPEKVQRKQPEGNKEMNPQSPQLVNQNQKFNIGVVSPMKSSESSSPSIKSPSSESRRSSSGCQALKSPTAQRSASAPVTMSGILYKQGSDGLKVWRKRWFVLSEYCLFYYKNQDEEKLLGSVLLPSYKVSPCIAEDKVLRKFAFKLEHANMRTYVLAAPGQEDMIKWVKVLTMATLMQTPSEPFDKQTDRTAARTEDDDETPGPTYANAPPKPRRSNEGYNSPSSDIYDPNYDLLKKPPTHRSQNTSYTRYLQDQNNYPNTSNQEPIYFRSPQSPSVQHQHQQRSNDVHNLSLPLNNTEPHRIEGNSNSSNMYKSNPQSSYFNDRTRNLHQGQQTRPSQLEQNQRNIMYDQQSQQNPFLQQDLEKEIDPSNQCGRTTLFQQDRDNPNLNESYAESQLHSKVNSVNVPYNREICGEQSFKTNKGTNERFITDRRTPDAYGRSTSMSAYSKERVGDYEDIYNMYPPENEYGQLPSKISNSQQIQDTISLASASSRQQQNCLANQNQEKTFSGPSVLRRKKMQSSGIQPSIPRPHSADFLDYESRNEILRNTPSRVICEPPKQPQRPKSSLEINSHYDPSSDMYYSEESYAEKMRQSAQYLHSKLAPRNIQIPLEKYASGLAEKQLHTAYSQTANNNYEAELGLNKNERETSSSNKKFSNLELLNANWTLKEKNEENQKQYRSGSIISNGSGNSRHTKESKLLDGTPENFIRSASARLPSTPSEKDEDKKLQQREESMKRLLEWKQRMLQSPLTRKSTPATISLARSLNQSRQSLKSDMYKTKTYSNNSYNSYSSDDEEESSDNDLQKPRKMQAGRSRKENIARPIVTKHERPHTPSSTSFDNVKQDFPSVENIKNPKDETSINNDYENIVHGNSLIQSDEYITCKRDMEAVQENHAVNFLEPNVATDDYDVHESEAESETQNEYTDNDLDEVLKNSDNDKIKNNDTSIEHVDDLENKTTSPSLDNVGESHYLPMSPRKISIVEPAHKSILQNLSVFDQTMPYTHEDNAYVEMNLGTETDEMQTYEIVCFDSSNKEPVYMELNNVQGKKNEILSQESKPLDTASNFVDVKEHTLKRKLKEGMSSKDKEGFEIKYQDSNFDINSENDESIKAAISETPFSRLSISDNFRPASYYLNLNQNSLESPDLSDSDNFSFTFSSSHPELSDEALSKYVLEKLDQSNISQDNSILKMLTKENQNLNTFKKKTTSLMIYGSKTSIHDTLSRGEKIKNSRASLVNEKNKTHQQVLRNEPILEHSASSVETDSLKSLNGNKNSRFSLNSDINSRFEATISKTSDDVYLVENEPVVELRNINNYQMDSDFLTKRRPVSDDDLFRLTDSGRSCYSIVPTDLNSNQNSTKFVVFEEYSGNKNSHVKNNTIDDECNKQIKIKHERCSSTPISTRNELVFGSATENCYKDNVDQLSSYTSQSICGSMEMSKSPFSYFCKDNEEVGSSTKNLSKEILGNDIKQDILAHSTTNVSQSSSVTNHSRDSSNEHNAPYYYSDLSSQEHINLLPTSHYLKNTNLHRKLNNQRRRGPTHKKAEISHIQNPIHNNNTMSDNMFDLVAYNRSVSVEYLNASNKDPEIDMKNIYESTSGKFSKIPESLILGFGCKKNSNNDSDINNSAIELSNSSTILNTSSFVKLSTTSVSSHCSGNSSNTVYYDAETEANDQCHAYENIVCQVEKHWDEDSVWRDNLRRASHRNARSMDDLDILPVEQTENASSDICGTNSIKRIKKAYLKKIIRNVTYVNTDIQSQVRKNRENSVEDSKQEENLNTSEYDKVSDTDEYVNLAKDAKISLEHSDEGVYEQLAVNSLHNPNFQKEHSKPFTSNKGRNKFEIDREKLRQWDLMSSGLMKAAKGRVRINKTTVGGVEALCSTDSGADSTSNEASLTMAGVNKELTVNNTIHQQILTKKSFLGSNTSIGRNNREANIPVRAVSPRVRWIEDKESHSNYVSQNFSTSQQNLENMKFNEDSWSTVRTPSRISQQPVRAVSPRVRINPENGEMKGHQSLQNNRLCDVPTAGELLGRTHEELVLLLIQLRRRHAATHRAIEHCCSQINSIEDCLSSLKVVEREENLQRLEKLKFQLAELEKQYEKSKPLVQLVDNMVKLGSLYNKPGSTLERLERNQRLRQKVLAEHALEQKRWLENAAAGKQLETEAARARVAELWALEQELADEAAILQGLKIDKDTIESLLTGVRGKLDSTPRADLFEGRGAVNGTQQNAPSNVGAEGLEAELARVHAMLALNSKKLEQTVADNARLERELQHLRRALQARRSAAPAQHANPMQQHPHSNATAMLEDEVSRVQQLVTALQRQRQELSRAVRHLTQQSQALQTTHSSMPVSQNSDNRQHHSSSWQETNLDTGHTVDHAGSNYEYESPALVTPPGHYDMSNMDTPLYVDTRVTGMDVLSPLTSEEIQQSAFGNLTNVEKQEIKTVRIVKRESERRQRDRERSLQPMSDWPSNNITANLDQFLEEELIQSPDYSRNRNDFSKFEEYYSKPQMAESAYQRITEKLSSMELSPKFPSSPSLSNYDFSRDISSLSSSYNRSYDRSGYDKTMSLSTQYLNSPTDSARTLTNDPLSKTSSIGSLTRSHVMELSPIFKSEAAKQIITEMSGDVPKAGSIHRRQVPKEKRRHYTAPHHLSSKTLNELPKNGYNHDKMGRSLDDADMERALRAPPDVVRSTIQPQRFAETTIDQLLAAPQKILIPERYIPEKPPELSPEEKQKRLEKVESIKKMLSSSSADPSKSPDQEEKRQREHLLQMNQLLAKQVTEMSKIIAVKALEELPRCAESNNLDDRSPDVELPIYQQRDNFFT